MGSWSTRMPAKINTIHRVFRIGVPPRSPLFAGHAKKKRARASVRARLVSLLRPRMTDKLNLRPINIINIRTQGTEGPFRESSSSRPAHARARQPQHALTRFVCPRNVH